MKEEKKIDTIQYQSNKEKTLRDALVVSPYQMAWSYKISIKAFTS